MLEWHADKILKSVDSQTSGIEKDVAAGVAKKAKNNLRRNQSISEKDRKHLIETVEARESKYKNGGYIVGVFDESTGEWVKTIGARSILLEFGHAAPGKGRGSVKRKDIKKAVQPKPFFRPAVKWGEKELMWRSKEVKV